LENNNYNIDIKSQMADSFQAGDEKALSFFYKEFHPALSLYAYKWLKERTLAEEIAAEALIKTWKMHSKLNSYAGIRAYLYKTVRRDCWRLAKTKKAALIDINTVDIPAGKNSPFDILLQTEVYRHIHTALKEVAPASRRVLIMHYLDGKTTGQIARELSLHPSTIKTQKKQGLAALRKKISRALLWFIVVLEIFLGIY
jgi:RNA polymerase sigma-70 factor, ECF subfamily